MTNSDNRALHQDGIPGSVQPFGQRFPHLPRAALRVLKFVDQGLHVALPAGEDCISDCCQKRQSLDPLGGPLSANRGAWNAPDFFSVRFEKNLVESASEAVTHPFLEVLFLRARLEP